MIQKQNNLLARVENCEVEMFRNIIASQKVKVICAQVAKLATQLETEKQQAEPNTQRCKELHNEMSRMKKKLPAFLFMANFPNGVRKQEDAILNGLYMADFDHLDFNDGSWKLLDDETDEQTTIHNLSTGNLKALGVLLAHVTPSGRGLRIVAKADAAIGNIADNQHYLAEKLGLPPDEACKDASRISFAFPEENLLYLDKELFTYNNPAYEAEFGESYRRGKSSALSEERRVMSDELRGMISPSGEERTLSNGNHTSKLETPNSALGKTLNSAQDFRGVAYSEIIKEWWRQQGGEPVEGERNQKLHRLAANLRYICDNSPQKLLSVMPSLGLSDAEMRSICSNACSSTVYQEAPKALRNVLKAVGIDNASNGTITWSNTDALKQLEKEFNKISLPPVLQAVVNGVNKQQRIGAVMASLPMFYTLLTRISFDHFDGSESRLSGMTFIIGPAAAGKSFINDLKRLLLAPISEADKAGRDAEEKYKEEKEESKNKDYQPKIPHHSIRVLPIQISNTILARRLRNAVDEQDKNLHLHCITVETELATAIRAAKGGSWIEKNDIYCKAFHNELWGMDYASDQATNGDVEVNYNLVVSGTDGAFNKFIPTETILSGLPTRLMYYQMPDMAFKMITKKTSSRTTAEEQLMKETAYRLDKLRGKIDAEKLTDSMFNWCKSMATRAMLEDDHELDDLRKRTALIGERAGVAFAILSQLDNFEKGAPLVFDKNTLRFAKFIADYTLYMQYTNFALRMREQKERESQYKGPNAKMSKMAEIYNQLPTTFIIADLQKLRPDASRNAIDLNINKWLKKAFINRTNDGVYEKIIRKV